jgi:anionic cell wall polymer biosynthesis LytR-Cps2A-Psr (LCP) family protein
MEKRTRKTKKRKWLRNTLLIALLLIVSTIIYSVYQYNSGLTEGSDGVFKDDGKTFDPFEGPEPQFGEINILLMGSDARPNRGGLSDTLMIAHYNQKTHNIKLASIMRDT